MLRTIQEYLAKKIITNIYQYIVGSFLWWNSNELYYSTCQFLYLDNLQLFQMVSLKKELHCCSKIIVPGQVEGKMNNDIDDTF